MADERRDGSFMVGLLVGAVAGGVVAGLLAPRSGEETRAIVRERGLELKDRAEDVVLRAQSVANDTMARVQQRTRSLGGQEPA